MHMHRYHLTKMKSFSLVVLEKCDAKSIKLIQNTSIETFKGIRYSYRGGYDVANVNYYFREGKG